MSGRKPAATIEKLFVFSVTEKMFQLDRELRTSALTYAEDRTAERAMELRAAACEYAAFAAIINRELEVAS